MLWLVSLRVTAATTSSSTWFSPAGYSLMLPPPTQSADRSVLLLAWVRVAAWLAWYVEGLDLDAGDRPQCVCVWGGGVQPCPHPRAFFQPAEPCGPRGTCEHSPVPTGLPSFLVLTLYAVCVSLCSCPCVCTTATTRSHTPPTPFPHVAAENLPPLPDALSALHHHCAACVGHSCHGCRHLLAGSHLGVSLPTGVSLPPRTTVCLALPTAFAHARLDFSVSVGTSDSAECGHFGFELRLLLWTPAGRLSVPPCWPQTPNAGLLLLR